MLNKDEFPTLRHMFECYFFEDWDGVFADDEEVALADFIAREPEEIARLKTEIDALLARDPDEAEIEAWMKGFYVGPLPPIKGFLADRRAQLVAALDKSA